jgi:hypothetical protein
VLCCVVRRQAEDDLHRYFDVATGGVSVQYAVLNLAVLHLHFGHLGEAMHAIHETVRVAQQSNDSAALAFAVSWLLRTLRAQKHATLAPPRSDAHGGGAGGGATSHHSAVREEERLLRRCFSCASEEGLPHLACLTALTCGRHVLSIGAPDNAAIGARADTAEVQLDPLPAAAWACQAAARQHGRRALMEPQMQEGGGGDGGGGGGGSGLAGEHTGGRRDCASAHGMCATIWQMAGHSTLARAMASLQLSHYADDGVRHDTVRVGARAWWSHTPASSLALTAMVPVSLQRPWPSPHPAVSLCAVRAGYGRVCGCPPRRGLR